MKKQTNPAAQSNDVLGAMKPSRAIVKLAIPATLALLAKAVYNRSTPRISGCCTTTLR